MRSSIEMMKLLEEFVGKNELIRAGVLNGSRVNPTIKADIFQDYDIVLFVTDVEPFRNINLITDHFGDYMLVQRTEDKEYPPAMNDGRYIYLMQFVDGNRFDLQFITVDRVEEIIKDSLSLKLYDKDGIIPDLPEPSEVSYKVQVPSEKWYLDTCDSFIWGLGSHIPKTIWREEVTLLMYLIDVVLRGPLIEMLEQSIGMKTNYEVSIGKRGKKLEQLLSEDRWVRLMKTYSDANLSNIWNSLYVLHDLYKEVAIEVGEFFGYRFPEDEMRIAYEFLQHVEKLPKDSISIF